MDDITQTIRPLLSNEDVITGMGSKLFIKTSVENFRQIQSIIKQLDHPPEQLKISVLQGLTEQELRARFGVSGEIRLGDMLLQSDDSNVNRFLLRRTHQHKSTAEIFSLKVLNNHRASIQTGLSRPVLQAIHQDKYGEASSASFQYKNAERGFYVLPKLLSDEKIQLEITPFSAHFSNTVRSKLDASTPAIENQIIMHESQTTVITGLNQWVVISGNKETLTHSGSRILATTRKNQRESRFTLIKVEVIDEKTP